MDLKQTYFSPQGRLNRSPYWIANIVLTVLNFAISFAVQISGIPILAVLSLILIWPSIMVAIKRCHDRDRSGWFLLIGSIPIVNLWPVVELGFLRGTEGDNRFGADPLAGAGATTGVAAPEAPASSNATAKH